jgi:hypothetical protein
MCASLGIKHMVLQTSGCKDCGFTLSARRMDRHVHHTLFIAQHAEKSSCIMCTILGIHAMKKSYLGV